MNTKISQERVRFKSPLYIRVECVKRAYYSPYFSGHTVQADQYVVTSLNKYPVSGSSQWYLKEELQLCFDTAPQTMSHLNPGTPSLRLPHRDDETPPELQKAKCKQ